MALPCLLNWECGPVSQMVVLVCIALPFWPLGFLLLVCLAHWVRLDFHCTSLALALCFCTTFVPEYFGGNHFYDRRPNPLQNSADLPFCCQFSLLSPSTLKTISFSKIIIVLHSCPIIFVEPILWIVQYVKLEEIILPQSSVWKAYCGVQTPTMAG